MSSSSDRLTAENELQRHNAEPGASLRPLNHTQTHTHTPYAPSQACRKKYNQSTYAQTRTTHKKWVGRTTMFGSQHLMNFLQGQRNSTVATQCSGTPKTPKLDEEEWQDTSNDEGRYSSRTVSMQFQ